MLLGVLFSAGKNTFLFLAENTSKVTGRGFLELDQKIL